GRPGGGGGFQRRRLPFTLLTPSNEGRGSFLSEERQWRLTKRFQGPQCAATVEPGRAEGVGLGKALKRAAAEPAAPPQRMWISVPLPSRGNEPFRIGLGEPLNLTQAEAQRPARTAIVIPAEAGIQRSKA